MFTLPPNCIVPSATSLTIRPVFPSFLYFISHTPCGRSGRHQIDTFESTWPGQNWAVTEGPVNVETGQADWVLNGRSKECARLSTGYAGQGVRATTPLQAGHARCDSIQSTSAA